MTFEQWLKKYCKVETFDETEGWFTDLGLMGIDGPDDILSYMQEAYEAGFSNGKASK